MPSPGRVATGMQRHSTSRGERTRRQLSALGRWMSRCLRRGRGRRTCRRQGHKERGRKQYDQRHSDCGRPISSASDGDDPSTDATLMVPPPVWPAARARTETHGSPGAQPHHKLISRLRRAVCAARDTSGQGCCTGLPTFRSCPNAHATFPADRACRFPVPARRCWARRPASAPTWCSSISKTRSRRSRSRRRAPRSSKAINDARLRRDRLVRARERVGHGVDLPRRDRGGRGRVGAARRAHAPEGGVRGRRARPRPAAHPDREDDRPPVASRYRSADRDRARA